MFEDRGDAHIELEQADVTRGQKATHMRYRIV